MDDAIDHIKPMPETSKRAQLIALLERDHGASLNDMVAATGWLPNTMRAALTGLRKSGITIGNGKVDGMRRYRTVAPVQ